MLRNTYLAVPVFLVLLWATGAAGQASVLVDYSRYNLSKPEYTYCYTCDASSEYHCYDPDIYLTRQEKCTYGCTTLITSHNGGEVVVRGCGTWMARWSEEGCTTNPNGDGTESTTCYCRTHFCNTRVVEPGSAVTMKYCYFCNYYGKVEISAAITHSCLTPGGATNKSPCPYGVCKKSVYTLEDFQGISRSCENNLLNLTERACVDTYTGSITTRVCHCDGDRCNSAPFTRGRWLLAVGAALLTYTLIKQTN